MQRRPCRGLALDLFCGAGGASMGLHRAGFEVVGVDLHPKPLYPFRFVQGDALSLSVDFLKDFRFVWASPPCQAFTAYKRRPGHVKPVVSLIPQTRALLRKAGVPYVIENVPGAPLEDPITLCGSMFNLDVRRHRIFECSFPVVPPSCNHAAQKPRFACATNRTNLRSTVEVACGASRSRCSTRRWGLIGWGVRSCRRLSRPRTRSSSRAHALPERPSSRGRREGGRVPPSRRAPRALLLVTGTAGWRRQRAP
jgi:DNA (cytosine-5)-methyltransferase 1